MRTQIVIALAALAAAFSAAGADTTSTTYVCTDGKGRKSIQDSPCPGDQHTRHVDTVQHQPTLRDAIAEMQRNNQAAIERSRCAALRRSPDVTDRRAAIESCKGF